MTGALPTLSLIFFFYLDENIFERVNGKKSGTWGDSRMGGWTASAEGQAEGRAGGQMAA
jgi:hypothetical protein